MTRNGQNSRPAETDPYVQQALSFEFNQSWWWWPNLFIVPQLRELQSELTTRQMYPNYDSCPTNRQLADTTEVAADLLSDLTKRKNVSKS